jgi:uncharacterized repeat protein (TIGR01451 family)
MTQAAPVYRYLLTHVLDSPLYESEGSFHGLELWFVFQHLDEVPGYWPKTADRDLEAAILSYWTRFAATGNPNGGGTTVWPVYEAASDPYLDLGSPIAARTGARTAECDFWDRLVDPVFILRQSASPTRAVAGGSLSYTLSLTNGGGDASGLVLRDVLGAGVTFRGASDGGQYQDGSVTWQLGELEAGQRLIRTVQVTVGSVPPGGVITNTVSVTCAEGVSTENGLALTVSASSGVMLPLVMARAE